MVALRTWAVSLVPESVYPQALSVDVVWVPVTSLQPTEFTEEAGPISHG